MVLGDFKGQKEKKPLAYRTSKLADTLSSKGAPCAVCGSYEDIQMHHSRWFPCAIYLAFLFLSESESKQYPTPSRATTDAFR
jgi:hypothetical protein